MSRDEFLNWDRSEIEGSEVDEQGWLTVQVNAYGEGAARSGMLLHSPYGLLGRPPDPDDKGACKALTAREGDQDHAIATVDLRVLKKLPRPKKGGSVQFGADGGFGSFDPEEHTWTLYIPVEFDSAGTPTKAHLLQIGKDTNGKRCITLLHADGPAISIVEGGKKSVVIKNAASNAYVEVNDDGIVLNGKVTIKGGLKADEGAGVAPVARSTELLTWAMQVNATLTALAAYVNGLAPGSVPPTLPLAPSVASFTLGG
jgi:hypothetical protein